MTGTEAAQAAKQYVNTYRYIYGAKGEYCSSEHIEELIRQSPSYFSDDQKKNVARAKAGSYCVDCSGYVCLCSNYAQHGSYALYDIAAEKYLLTVSAGKVLANGTFIPVGAIVWKPGHVGIYIGNQTVVEARSEFVDIEVNTIGNRDFTHCLLLPGIQYTVYTEDAAVENGSISGSENGYTEWTGKVVNTPVVVPQISTTNKQAAAGFGMLNNGEFVTVTGVSGEYYRIRSQSGYYAYVYSYYIGTTGAAAYENQYCQWKGSANSTTGTVNIRSGPGTEYNQISSVPSVLNGSVMDVLGEVLGADNKLWYYIRVLGQYYGYVRGDLISRLVMVNYNSWIGEAQSTTGIVNIRTAPTVNSALSLKYGPLNNGDTIKVINEVRGLDGVIWYAVSANGTQAGFCRFDLIRPYCENYYVEWDGVIQTTTGSANIRTDASTAAGKVTGSPYANGTGVHVFGEVTGEDGYTWYKLSVNNMYVGYCRCDLITVTDDYPHWSARANTTTGTLNIRTNAGSNYSLIDGCPSVANGTELRVVRQMCGTDGFVWYEVYVKGTYHGYVKGTLVEPVNTPAYPVWMGCARSTTGVVNIRSQASTASEVISGYPQLKNGDCFEVIDQTVGNDGYLWFKVRIMGIYIGYIRSDLVSHGVLEENSGGYASWAGIAKSTTGTVNVRAGAGTGTALVLALKNGDGVEVIGTTNGTDGYVWYQVKVNNVNGYIRSDLVVHIGNVEGSGSSEILPERVEISCMKTGVIIRTAELKTETTQSAEGRALLQIGTYVDITNIIILPDGSKWLYCVSQDADGYVEERFVNLFPVDEACGGNESANLENHQLVHKEYGVYECSQCGYHIEEKLYYSYLAHKKIPGILDVFNLPEEIKAVVKTKLSIGIGSVKIALLPWVDIIFKESFDFESDSEGNFVLTFEDDMFRLNEINIAWNELNLKLSELGIDDTTFDVNQLALAVGTGNLEVSYEINPEIIEITFSISIPLPKNVTFNFEVKFVIKKDDILNNDEVILYNDMAAIPNINVEEVYEGVVLVGGMVAVGILLKIAVGVAASAFPGGIGAALIAAAII